MIADARFFSMCSDYSHLEVMRLSFLNLGPNLPNLNQPFFKVQTLYLQYNTISSLDDVCFQCLPNLKYLALQNNVISEVGQKYGLLKQLGIPRSIIQQPRCLWHR